MAKVLKGFYCTKERQAYVKGDDYNGGRKDLGHLIEAPKKKEVKEPVKTKELKTSKATK